MLNGKVIQALDNNTRVVINKGSDDGVSESSRFLIYRLGDDMIDPDTHENLGKLELVYGEGKPIHIQERFTTLESARTQKVAPKPRTWGEVFGLASDSEVRPEPKEVLVPFKDVEPGCLFKQIR